MNQDYLVTGETTKIRENGATNGIGVLATFGYDDLGRRTSLTFGNGASQGYSFDAVSRLASLTANLSGTTNDLTIGSMSYNPASQIVSQNRSNDAFAWTGHGSGSTASVANGLNQLTSIGGSATSHDARGNLTSDPTTGKTYGYSSENLLTSASGGVTLAYDPQLRLYQVAGAATTRFAYDGINVIAEYNGSNALQRRFVFGPGVDEPLVQYEGSGTTDRRFLHADERGSIVAISDGTGAMLTINKYDEFGKPQAGNAGRFQYTGQMWLPEVGLYYYKARMYAPHLGRFLQTDPVGYWDSPNPYVYVLNDPLNRIDPLGLGDLDSEDEIVVTGKPYVPNVSETTMQLSTQLFGHSMGGYDAYAAFTALENQAQEDEIVITAWKTKKLGKFRLNLHSGKEEFYKINEKGEIEKVPLKEETVDCGNGLEISKNRLPNNAFASGDRSGVHTHGWGGPLSGIPGSGDAGIPLRFGISLYGITQYGVWRISPAGAGVSVTLLGGSWGPGASGFNSGAYGAGRNAGTKTSNRALCSGM